MLAPAARESGAQAEDAVAGVDAGAHRQRCTDAVEGHEGGRSGPPHQHGARHHADGDGPAEGRRRDGRTGSTGGGWHERGAPAGGSAGATSVVKVSSAPAVVPEALVATTRKW